jgi:aminopeptidase N
MRRVLRTRVGLAFIAILPLAAAPLRRPYTAEHYDVRIQVDLANQRLHGEVKIRFHSQADTPISALDLDAGGLEVASVVEGQAPQYFERNGGALAVVLTNPLRPDEHRTITVRYEAGPAPGLKFFADQIYTTVASDWMPCNDRPDERATLQLTISAPPGAEAVGSGQRSGSEGQNVTEWMLDSASAPSRFGFAVGRFAERTSQAEGVKLRVLTTGRQDFDFEPTAAALHYLDERTGKRYPGQSYTQVFVHGDAIHSMAGGLTLLPEEYAQGFGKQPDTLWLLTSELAHQWYGVGVGLKDWSDLWLSEGVSAFVADGLLLQRLGKQSYDKELEHSRQIYNRFRTEDKDRPLDYTEWTTREDADGEIPIHKGASFLYLVDELVGDSAFWDVMRTYTSEEWGHAASSEDFQKAFGGAKPEAASAGKKSAKAARKNTASPLDALFDTWVYGISRGNAKK